jgi:hypothetical protein
MELPQFESYSLNIPRPADILVHGIEIYINGSTIREVKAALAEVTQRVVATRSRIVCMENGSDPDDLVLDTQQKKYEATV